MGMSAFQVPEPSPLSLVCLIVHRTLSAFARFPAYKVSSPFSSCFQNPVEFIVRIDWNGFYELPKANCVKIALSVRIMALQSSKCEFESGLCTQATICPWINQPL